jgi:hypothetical protein
MLALATLLAGCHDYDLNHVDTDAAGAAPQIVVDPPSLDFGVLPLGSTLPRTFRIENRGDADLLVDNVEIRGNDAFTLLSSAAGTIAPGEGIDVVVQFEADDLGSEAQAIVTSDDALQPSVPVDLRGDAALGVLSVTPNPVEFGSVAPLSTDEQTVTVSNDGLAPVSVTSTVVTGTGFGLGLIPRPFTLEAGESTTVPVTFAPDQAGDYSGTLSFGVVGDVVAPATVVLHGTSELNAVTGRICDPSGNGWVVGARVWTFVDYDGDGNTDAVPETLTDADGRFTLEGVPAGTTEIYVQKGSYNLTITANVQGGGEYELPDPECLPADDVNIAVVQGRYDHVEMLLDGLDIPWTGYDGVGDSTDYLDLLLDPVALSAYDVLFLNCGINTVWMQHEDEVAENLRDFVAGGGSIYASDYAYAFIEQAWPDMVDFHGDDTVYGSAFRGATQTVEAELLDDTLQGAVGSDHATVRLAGGWAVPEAAADEGEVLATADVTLVDGTTVVDAPLVVRHDTADGAVILTAFHNEAEMDESMLAALQDMILSL